MKKTYFLLIFILLLFSCDGLEYSGETKYVFEGRLSDRNGQPLEDIVVSVHVSKNGSPVLLACREIRATTTLFPMCDPIVMAITGWFSQSLPTRTTLHWA